MVNLNQFEQVPKCELLNLIKDICLVAFFTLLVYSGFPSFRLPITKMKEGTKYRKGDGTRGVWPTIDITYRAITDDGIKKKTGTRTVWPIKLPKQPLTNQEDFTKRASPSPFFSFVFQGDCTYYFNLVLLILYTTDGKTIK